MKILNTKCPTCKVNRDFNVLGWYEDTMWFAYLCVCEVCHERFIAYVPKENFGEKKDDEMPHPHETSKDPLLN